MSPLEKSDEKKKSSTADNSHQTAQSDALKQLLKRYQLPEDTSIADLKQAIEKDNQSIKDEVNKNEQQLALLKRYFKK